MRTNNNKRWWWWRSSRSQREDNGMKIDTCHCQSGHVSRAEQTIYILGNLGHQSKHTISEGSFLSFCLLLRARLGSAISQCCRKFKSIHFSKPHLVKRHWILPPPLPSVFAADIRKFPHERCCYYILLWPTQVAPIITSHGRWTLSTPESLTLWGVDIWASYLVELVQLLVGVRQSGLSNVMFAMTLVSLLTLTPPV